MNQDQLQELVSSQPLSRLVSVRMLDNKQPRTLLYGNDGTHIIHLYLGKDQKFHLRVYLRQNQDFITDLDTTCIDPGIAVPQRIHPFYSDYEFCRLLISRGYAIEFAPFTHGIPQVFYGRL